MTEVRFRLQVLYSWVMARLNGVLGCEYSRGYLEGI